MEAIRLEDYSFYYPGEEKAALSNINFAVNFGEFITICGHSGSGKSTLLKCLKPEASPHGKRLGKMFSEGEQIADISSLDDSKIGFVMQNPDGQIVTDTVWHELSFGLENMGMNQVEMRLRVAEIASFFGIEKWFHKNTSELSGGQKQILNLASVMVMEPEVLILDEPTSQLDPISAGEFLSTLSRVNRELGTTVILSEHRTEEAFAYSDRIVVMKSGRIVADELPENIGRVLLRDGNSMFSALPASVRIFEQIDGRGACPVTVAEARNWLKSFADNRGACAVYLPEKTREFANEVAVSLKNLYYKYEKNGEYVISGLSQDVKKGECFGILGGNGTGKTTLLWLIAKGLKIQSGKIKACGKVMMLSQNPELMFTKNTVFEEVPCREKLEEYGLFRLKDRHPYDLSGGEQQKLALLKVLAEEPDILLLDEPTKGLDAQFKQELCGILDSLCKSGVTVIMVSHDVEFCAKACHRCGLLFDGELVSVGEVREFFGGKKFYTTQTARIMKGFAEGIILAEDAVSLLEILEENK